MYWQKIGQYFAEEIDKTICKQVLIVHFIYSISWAVDMYSFWMWLDILIWNESGLFNNEEFRLETKEEELILNISQDTLKTFSWWFSIKKDGYY